MIILWNKYTGPSFIMTIYQATSGNSSNATGTMLFSIDCFVKENFKAKLSYAFSYPLLLSLAPIAMILVPLVVIPRRSKTRLAEMESNREIPMPEKRDIIYKTMLEHKELKSECKKKALVANVKTDIFLFENKEFYEKVESQLHVDLLNFKDRSLSDEDFMRKIKTVKYEANLMKQRILSKYRPKDMSLDDYLLKCYDNKEISLQKETLKNWRANEAYKSGQGI